MYFKIKINKFKINNIFYYHNNIVMLSDSDDFFKDECIGFDFNITLLNIDDNSNNLKIINDDNNGIDIKNLIDELNKVFK
jgi:hypothetical protein